MAASVNITHELISEGYNAMEVYDRTRQLYYDGIAEGYDAKEVANWINERFGIDFSWDPQEDDAIADRIRQVLSSPVAEEVQAGNTARIIDSAKLDLANYEPGEYRKDMTAEQIRADNEQRFAQYIRQHSVAFDDSMPRLQRIREGATAGFSQSVSGLKTAGNPRWLTADAPWYARAAEMAGQILGDLPAYWTGGKATAALVGPPLFWSMGAGGAAAGAAVGGVGAIPGAATGEIAAATLTAMAAGGAAMAFTESLRRDLMDQIILGKATGLTDYMVRGERAARTAINAFTLGAMAGPIGSNVESSIIAATERNALKKFAPAISQIASAGAEGATFGVMSPALEGRLPTYEDVMHGIILMGAMRYAHVTGLKFKEIFAQHGISPRVTMLVAKADLNIRQAMAAVNVLKPKELGGNQRKFYVLDLNDAGLPDAEGHRPVPPSAQREGNWLYTNLPEAAELAKQANRSQGIADTSANALVPYEIEIPEGAKYAIINNAKEMTRMVEQFYTDTLPEGETLGSEHKGIENAEALFKSNNSVFITWLKNGAYRPLGVTGLNPLDALVFNGRIKILNPDIVNSPQRSKAVAQSAANLSSIRKVTEMVNRAATRIFDPVGKLKNARTWFLDRIAPLNAGAPRGKRSIPYLMASLYAGKDGIVEHIIRFGQVAFAHVDPITGAIGERYDLRKQYYQRVKALAKDYRANRDKQITEELNAWKANREADLKRELAAHDEAAVVRGNRINKLRDLILDAVGKRGTRQGLPAILRQLRSGQYGDYVRQVKERIAEQGMEHLTPNQQRDVEAVLATAAAIDEIAANVREGISTNLINDLHALNELEASQLLLEQYTYRTPEARRVPRSHSVEFVNRLNEILEANADQLAPVRTEAYTKEQEAEVRKSITQRIDSEYRKRLMEIPTGASWKDIITMAHEGAQRLMLDQEAKDKVKYILDRIKDGTLEDFNEGIKTLREDALAKAREDLEQWAHDKSLQERPFDNFLRLLLEAAGEPLTAERPFNPYTALFRNVSYRLDRMDYSAGANRNRNAKDLFETLKQVYEVAQGRNPHPGPGYVIHQTSRTSSVQVRDPNYNPHRDYIDLANPKLAKELQSVISDYREFLQRAAELEASKINEMPETVAEADRLIEAGWNNLTQALAEAIETQRQGYTAKEYRAKEAETNAAYEELITQARQDLDAFWNSANADDPLMAFRAFIMARHAVDMTQKGEPHGLDMEAIFDIANNPRLNEAFGKAANELYALNRYLLQYQVDAGLITQERMNQITNEHPYFVPFERYEDLTGEVPYSQRMIIDPLETIVGMISRTIAAAERNQVIRTTAITYGTQKVADAPATVGTFKDWTGAISEKVSAKGQVTVSYMDKGKQQTWRVPTRIAEALNEMDPLGAQFAVKGSTLERAGRQVANIAARIAAFHRQGITLSPEFQIRNPFRDQFSAYIQSEAGYQMFVDFVGALPEILVNKGGRLGAVAQKLFPEAGEWYREYIRNGAGYAHLVALDRPSVQRLNESLQDMYNPHNSFGFTSQTFNNLLHVFNPLNWHKKSGLPRKSISGLTHMMQETSTATEEMTRLGDYIRCRERGFNGLEAAFNSREVTVDFAKAGTIMKAINALASFSNAKFQGADRFFRAFYYNPARTLERTFRGIFVPSLLVAMATHEIIRDGKDDPDSLGFWLSQIPQWMRQNYFILPNIGLGSIFRINKPQEYGVIFGALANDFADFLYDKDPNAQLVQKIWDNGTVGASMDVLNLGFTPLINTLLPDAAKVPLEISMNFDLFTEAPIVPAAAENRLYPDRWLPQTTELSKSISRALYNLGIQPQGRIAQRMLSPIAIDYVIDGWGGTLGAQVYNLLSTGLGMAGAIDKSLMGNSFEDSQWYRAFNYVNGSMGSQELNRLYSRLNHYRQVFNSHQFNMRNQTPTTEEMAENAFSSEMLVNTRKIDTFLSKQREAIRMLLQNPKREAWEKRAEADEMYLQMIQIAIEINRQLDEAEEQFNAQQEELRRSRANTH